MPSRSSELPASGVGLEVVDDGPWAHDAVAFLASRGRVATLALAGEDNWRPGRLWRESRIAAKIVESLPRTVRILDLGCGAGRDAVFLAAHGFPIIAIDRLPESVTQTQALAARHAVNVVTQVADARRDPLPDADLWLMVRLYDPAILARRPSQVGAAIQCFSKRHQTAFGKPKHAPELADLVSDATLYAEEFEEEGKFLCAALTWPRG